MLGAKTAFIDAHLPGSFEAVYVCPPQALIEFGLVAPGTVWRVIKAIYGLRISPKAWGIERDRELKKMSFKVDGKPHVFVQSAIDPSVLMIVRWGKGNNVSKGVGSGGIVSEDAGRPLHARFDPEVAESQCFGYLATYVDDFQILASDPVIEQVRGVIEAKWRITEKPTVSFGSGSSVEYLSVNITALEHGYFPDQAVYCADLLATCPWTSAVRSEASRTRAGTSTRTRSRMQTTCTLLSGWRAALTGLPLVPALT